MGFLFVFLFVWFLFTLKFMKKLRVNVSEKSYWFPRNFHLFTLSREKQVEPCNPDFTEHFEDCSVLGANPSSGNSHRENSITIVLATITSDVEDAMVQE